MTDPNHRHQAPPPADTPDQSGEAAWHQALPTDQFAHENFGNLYPDSSVEQTRSTSLPLPTDVSQSLTSNTQVPEPPPVPKVSEKKPYRFQDKLRPAGKGKAPFKPSAPPNASQQQPIGLSRLAPGNSQTLITNPMPSAVIAESQAALLAVPTDTETNITPTALGTVESATASHTAAIVNQPPAVIVPPQTDLNLTRIAVPPEVQGASAPRAARQSAKGLNTSSEQPSRQQKPPSGQPPSGGPPNPPTEGLAATTPPSSGRNVARWIAWMGLGAILTTACALLYLVTSYKPSYESESKVIIRNASLASNYLTKDRNSMLDTTSQSTNPIYNMMGLLQSTEVKEALWRFFKTKHPEELKKRKIKNHAEWNEFAEDLSRMIQARNLAATDIIEIKLIWDDRYVARDALKSALKAFQEVSLKLNQADQIARSDYLKSRIDDITKSLSKIRLEKAQFKSDSQTLNLEKQSEALGKAIIDLKTSLNQTQSELEGRQAEVDRYVSLLGMSTENAMDAVGLGLNENLRDLYDRLYVLSQRYANLRSAYTLENPKVHQVLSEIIEVRRDIDAEVQKTIGKKVNLGNIRSISDRARGQAVNEMVQAAAAATRLREQVIVTTKRLNDLETEAGNFPGVEERIHNIEEQERSLSGALDTLREQWLEANLKRADSSSNVYIIDEPNLPKVSRFPRPVHIVLLALLAGLMIGAAIAWLLEKIREQNNAAPLYLAGQVYPGNTWAAPHKPQAPPQVTPEQSAFDQLTDIPSALQPTFGEPAAGFNDP